MTNKVISETNEKESPFYATSQEIAKRLHLEATAKGAEENWKKYQKQCANLDEITTTLQNLQLYHQRMYSIINTEANRLADLAEILVPK